MGAPADTEAIKQIAVLLRQRAGSRQKLAAALDVSITTAQNWEKQGRIPEGRHLARIVKLYPDLGAQLIDAIAPGVEAFHGGNPGGAEDAAAEARARARAARRAARTVDGAGRAGAEAAERGPAGPL